MIGNPILIQVERLKTAIELILPMKKAEPQLALHGTFLEGIKMPHAVQHSPVANRYLDLLGVLDWTHLPGRNLERNWGQTTIPYAAFIAAYLVKLNEGRNSLGDVRVFLSENPALTWLLGFPLAVSKPGEAADGISCTLPTTRHLTHMLRVLPNAVLQFLLEDSVRLIRAELAKLGAQTGECISLHTKHILAWVKDLR